MKDDQKNIAHKPQPDYEKAKMDQLRMALKRTPEERFNVLMELIKLNIMLRKAKIIRNPLNKAT